MLKPSQGGKKICGSIWQYLHIPSEELQNQAGAGWDWISPTGTTPAASASCPSIVPKDRAGRGPAALMCDFISGFELQDLPGFLDVLSLTPGGFSRALCSAFHLTAAQLNRRDAEIIVGRRREPERDSSNTKNRGKCQSW